MAALGAVHHKTAVVAASVTLYGFHGRPFWACWARPQHFPSFYTVLCADSSFFVSIYQLRPTDSRKWCLLQSPVCSEQGFTIPDRLSEQRVALNTEKWFVKPHRCAGSSWEPERLVSRRIFMRLTSCSSIHSLSTLHHLKASFFGGGGKEPSHLSACILLEFSTF